MQLRDARLPHLGALEHRLGDPASEAPRKVLDRPGEEPGDGCDKVERLFSEQGKQYRVGVALNRLDTSSLVRDPVELGEEELFAVALLHDDVNEKAGRVRYGGDGNSHQ